MAASASPWTTKGSNTNAGSNTDGSINPGDTALNKTMRHECQVWLDGTDKIVTKDFDFPINGDFTVVLNATKHTIASDAGNVDVDIEGSVDGTNYVKLLDGLTWDAGTTETQIDHFVYDFDDGGRMPYMRIAFDCGSDNDNRHLPIKVVVIPH